MGDNAAVQGGGEPLMVHDDTSDRSRDWTYWVECGQCAARSGSHRFEANAWASWTYRFRAEEESARGQSEPGGEDAVEGAPTQSTRHSMPATEVST